MKILVTGASGFIGYKLASDLADSGHEVVALCNKNSAPRGCTSIIADLADRVPDIPNGRYDISWRSIYHWHGCSRSGCTLETLAQMVARSSV